MSLVRTTLIVLLLAFGMSSAGEAQDFRAVPPGSSIRFPSGDTLVVGEGFRLVSDSAIISMDVALRSARQRLDECRASLGDRREQVRLLTEATDSLERALAGEQAWREVTTRILEEQNGGLVETLENFGLATAGFAVCRLTEPRD